MTTVDHELLIERVHRILDLANTENRDLSDFEESRVQTLMDILDACIPLKEPIHE